MSFQVLDFNSNEGQEEATSGSRPFIINQGGKKRVMVRNSRGLVVNSLLTDREWKELDTAVIEAAKPHVRAVAGLMSRGLRKQLRDAGTLTSHWNQASELTPANVSMTGASRGEQDRLETQQSGVPVPVIFKEFEIPIRQLKASRRSGEGIDVTTAVAAAEVVGDGIEGMLFTGSNVSLNNTTIYGFLNHPNRITDSAVNFGGGSWSVVTNIKATILGMLAAAAAQFQYGPFGIYLNPVDYLNCLEDYPDGKDDTPLQRILDLPDIEFVEPSYKVPLGQLSMVRLAASVVDIAEAEPLMVKEWVSGDGAIAHFKVSIIAVPRVKADINGRAGIIHATGI